MADSFLSRIFGKKQLADNADASLPQYPAESKGPPPPQEDPDVRRVVIHREQIGSSGVQSYFGYVQEDYLQNLRGHARADIYDKMRRSDPQVKMALSAVKNPIKSATWSIEPGDDSADAKADAELIQHILLSDMDRPFQMFLHEALSCVDFGHSVFETVHKVVQDHPKFGTFIGIKQFGHRSPRTIHRFNIDQDTGDLLSITQYAYGDLERVVDIPAEFLVVFSIDQEGDNYEGISFLRACYGPYLRKNMYQKLMAIGIEKYAVPTPVATVPEGKQNSQEYANLVQMLQIWTGHQQNYVTKPQGWEIEFQPNPFDAEKVQYAIDAEDKAMINAFVANFLDLGTSAGGHGSFALGEDKSQFFLGGLEQIGKLICEVMNRGPIRQLIRLNRGERQVYPRLTCSGITDKGGLELAQAFKLLAESQVIIPDDVLEDNVRSRYKMPKRSDKGQRQVNSPGSPTAPNDNGIDIPVHKKKDQANQFSEPREFSFAEMTARAHIKESKAGIKDFMQSALSDIGKSMIAQIISKTKRAQPSKRRVIINDIAQPGSGQYKVDLVTMLAGIADRAIAQARKEVPKAKNIKLSEFDDLPPEVQSKIKAQVALLSASQLSELEKYILFQFDASIDSTDSMDTLEKDLKASVDSYVSGVSLDAAAGNVAAVVINIARNAFFFDDDVIEHIESFTFTNPSPSSPICQDLAGTTFAADDGEANRYFPPLHHNCHSFLVPNIKGGPNAGREVEDLKPSSSDLEKYITLAEK